MDVRFADRKLAKECNDERLLQRKHGAHRAGLLKKRLAMLASSTCLADLGPPYRGPMRCHELRADRAGQFSIDLDHPYRLVFAPDHEPVPVREEGGTDWGRITAITILGIVDTHE